MKKIFVTLAVLVGFAMQALAYDFEVDGIYYNLLLYTGNQEVQVTHCAQPGWNCYSGDVIIPEIITYEGDSDAILVKGMVALLIRVLSGHTPREITDADLYFIDRIQLREHLSPTRSNGLAAMLKQMRLFALTFLAK